MAVAPAQSLSNSDTIRNVGRILPWLAGLPDGPEPDRFDPASLARTPDYEIKDAVADLERNFRKRHNSVSSVISAMTEKLRSEIEAATPGTVLDPDGTGVEALEYAEKHFQTECDELHEIRNALDQSGGQSAHGKSVFRELDRLEGLFSGTVRWCQEIRWLLMINDGALAPTTGKTFASGAELVSSLTSD